MSSLFLVYIFSIGISVSVSVSGIHFRIGMLGYEHEPVSVRVPLFRFYGYRPSCFQPLSQTFPNIPFHQITKISEARILFRIQQQWEKASRIKHLINWKRFELIIIKLFRKSNNSERPQRHAHQNERGKKHKNSLGCHFTSTINSTTFSFRTINCKWHPAEESTLFSRWYWLTRPRPRTYSQKTKKINKKYDGENVDSK